MSDDFARLPSGWQRTRLDRVASVNARIGWKALTAAEYQPDGYAFLATPNIKGREIDFEQVNYISEFRYEESPELKLCPGDVLLAKDGNTLGIVNLVKSLPRPATVNGSIAVIRPNAFDSAFLRYVLMSSPIQGRINAFKDGMGVPHLFQWDINRFPLPSPPIETQRAIADFLDTETARIDALITKKQRMIELLEARRQAVVMQGVSGSLRNSGVRLRHVSRLVRGSGFPHEHQGREEGDLPFFKVGDLSRPGNDPYLLECGNWISHETAAALRATVVPPGSVMFPKIGAALAGGVRRITTVPSVCDNNVLAVVPTETEARYLRYWLSTVDLAEIANPGPVPSLDDDALRDLSLPLADLETQSYVADCLDSATERMNTVAARVQSQVGLLREHRQALITAVVTGELEVPGVAA